MPVDPLRLAVTEYHRLGGGAPDDAVPPAAVLAAGHGPRRSTTATIRVAVTVSQRSATAVRSPGVVCHGLAKPFPRVGHMFTAPT
ncbi:hypothetical protein GCM10017687_00060 [Streptomyces echinatus]